MTDESQLLTSIDSGVQAVIPAVVLASPQKVYLDFNGATTSYFNRDLDIRVDDIQVQASGFGDEAVQYIVDTLNRQFDDVFLRWKLPKTRNIQLSS